MLHKSARHFLYDFEKVTHVETVCRQNVHIDDASTTWGHVTCAECLKYRNQVKIELINPKENKMAKLTVNSAIELVSTLRARLEDVKQLRDRNICDTEEEYSGKVTKKTVLFDPTVIDERVVDIQNAIRNLNSAIKESNARTSLDVPSVDELKLLSAIQKRVL